MCYCLPACTQSQSFIAWSHYCLKWCCWCFDGYNTTAVRTCCPGLRTCWQAITQRSTGNVTFLHPFHCCRTWCQLLWKSPNSTCTFRMSHFKQFKCVANTKLQDLVENGNQSALVRLKLLLWWKLSDVIMYCHTVRYTPIFCRHLSFTTFVIQENVDIDVSSVRSFVLKQGTVLCSTNYDISWPRQQTNPA
jgi:hypothetical protein